jgi:hypothetical protein
MSSNTTHDRESDRAKQKKREREGLRKREKIKKLAAEMKVKRTDRHTHSERRTTGRDDKVYMYIHYIKTERERILHSSCVVQICDSTSTQSI